MVMVIGQTKASELGSPFGSLTCCLRGMGQLTTKFGTRQIEVRADKRVFHHFFPTHHQQIQAG
jgi:hypothetical protein